MQTHLISVLSILLLFLVGFLSSFVAHVLVLLEKTRVTVGGSFSITGHARNEDCIREHGMMRETPVCLVGNVAVSPLALENIERMAPNSIGCVLERFNLSDTGLINILPKLRVHKDCEIEYLNLSASEEAHVAEVLKQKNPFCVGRVKNMDLKEYAVGVITKMNLKDCEIETLILTASEEAHVAAVLKQENPFCVGRVKDMWLGDYAVGVITKMSLKDCEIERLDLTAYEKEHVAEVLAQEKPFCVGRVKNMFLWAYAASVITKMSLKDCEIESLSLTAYEKEHVAEVLAQEKPFCVGRVKTMELGYYAVGVITKMSLKDCEIKYLSLYANEEAHVAAVLAQEKPFCVGRVKDMRLWDYAVSVITKMTIHEDNTMESFVLRGNEDQLSRILKEGDNSIELGRIRTGGLRVPEKIKRKLRYTLVDGEGKEVLEEEEPSQRGNLLE
ncbi:MAG: uncharacterized protein A8A55_2330 [Amphiamblys sp. WSBS2006]|nr:MAG: uncharacterized protein A8A55_2330 [Amphiamblys sp. WSBS2006]